MSPDRIENQYRAMPPQSTEIPRDGRGRIRWSVLRQNPANLEAVIEQEVLLTLRGENQLTPTVLRGAGRHDVLSGIFKFYPDGIEGLRAKLELSNSRNSPGHWIGHEGIKNIQDEARAFYDHEGRLTASRLVKGQQRALVDAVRSNYPGGFIQLKRDLGITPERRYGYWNQQTVLAEAQEFLRQTGDFSVGLLVQHGRRDLVQAIDTYYPGKFTHLKKVLGVATKSKPQGYWKSAENIRQEATKVIQEEGTIGSVILRHRNLSSLRRAISTSYPGGFIGLRQDLGLIDERKRLGFWTEETMRAEALGIFEKEGKLSLNVLEAMGRGGLAYTIVKRYPGGVKQLKKDLGIRFGYTTVDHWTTEQIEAEAGEFVQREGKLTTTLLFRRRRSDLYRAISQLYPGGLSQMRINLELPVPRKDGYWTRERVEEEAREFYLAYGGLTQTLLNTIGKGDLLAQISRRYPGGLSALKKKLGIIPEKDEIISPEEANEQLRKLLEE